MGSRALDGLRENKSPLIFTRNGIAFDDDDNFPTELPTSAPVKQSTNAPTNATTNKPTNASTNASTNAPTNAPTTAPTKAPTTMSPCSEHKRKKKCRKDKINRCKWEKGNKQCI